MCGFCGFTGKLETNQTVIENMMNKILHRGPDSGGVFSDDFVTLGFRRLSIIGLEDGSQPMFNEDSTIAIVFNGEIYNYKPLKDDLIEKGHIFHSHADTEVLIHLYEEYGTKLLDKIRGMFAFAIYDMKEKKIFIARDFFGIKPLYYTKMGNSFIFGSEIKSFLEHPNFRKRVNTKALEHYLTFQYSVLPETFFAEVYKLMPSHYLIYQNDEITIERYYQPEFKPEEMTLEQAKSSIDKAIQDSILAHKVSDVEVGSFLSSGVDSSYVASCFKGDKTFTVGFDYDKYNEIDYAKTLSTEIGITNYNKTISTDEYWNAISKVQYHMDEPLADPSAIALYFVSGLASNHLKVALSGEGADEFFGGYNIYREPMDLKFLTRIPMFLRKTLSEIAKSIPFSFKGKNFLIRGGQDVEDRFIGNAKMFSKEERELLLKNNSNEPKPQEITQPLYDKIKHYDDETKMQYLDIHLWLVGDILLKADKMSMAHSLEVRVPFLDKVVFEAASKLPTNLRVNKKATKYAFREASKEYLPESVSSKKKLGFPVPIRIWLKEDKYYEIVKEAFTGSTSKMYFEENYLMNLLSEHKNSKKDNSRKIWTIYMFLVWHKEYFEF